MAKDLVSVESPAKARTVQRFLGSKYVAKASLGHVRDLPKSQKGALVAGVAQGLAVIPGVSRSGTTISSLLWLGASGTLAARISFLMYLLVSTGVAILGIGELRSAPLELAPIAAMALASFITGYIAILWLFRLLRRGQFRLFAPYLWLVAAITLVHVGLSRV